MNEAVSLGMVVSIGSALVVALFSLIAWMISRWLDGLRGDVQQLQGSDAELSKQIASLRVELPREYVRRDDWHEWGRRVELSVQELRVDVRDGFARVYDRLDGKADKT